MIQLEAYLILPLGILALAFLFCLSQWELFNLFSVIIYCVMDLQILFPHFEHEVSVPSSYFP